MGFDDDPQGAWLDLKEDHAGSTSQGIATMTIALNAMKLQEGATLDEANAHTIAERNRFAAQLKQADPERGIQPADMATKILMSLPQEYKTIKFHRLSGPTEFTTLSSINRSTDFKSEGNILRKLRYLSWTALSYLHIMDNAAVSIHYQKKYDYHHLSISNGLDAGWN